MEISVNGKTEIYEKAISVLQLLELKSTDPASVVIEHNKNILKTKDYHQTFLKDSDTIEILRFVGGG